MNAIDEAAKPSFRRSLQGLAQDRLPINFGGPAGQIALMHRIVVDEKKWVDEARFLHALNFCMLLPGPEAHAARHLCRLAAAWRARRTCRRHSVRAARRLRDAGPEPALCLWARRSASDRRRAVRHQGRRAGDRGRGADPHRQARAEDQLCCSRSRRLAFIGIFFFALPFPLIVVGGGADRLSGHRAQSARRNSALPRQTDKTCRRRRKAAGGNSPSPRSIGLTMWWAPVALAALRCSAAAMCWWHRRVLLQARGGELRRRLCAAGLHGAAGGGDLRLADRAGNGGRPRPGRDHAGPADPGDAIRRLPRRVPRRRAVLAAHRRPARRGDDDLGDLRAVDAVDFRRRAVHRGAARQPPAVRRARGHHRRRRRRHPQSVGLVRAACAVRQGDRNACRPAALVCLRSAGARYPRRRAGGDRGRAGLRPAPQPDRSRRGDGGCSARRRIIFWASVRA